MRMCGHAHHDDMLYLGRDPHPSWEYPPLPAAGVRRSRAVRVLGGARSDSTLRRAARRPRASSRRAISSDSSARREAIVDEQARASSMRRGRIRATAGRGVFADETPRVHVEVLDPDRSGWSRTRRDRKPAAADARSGPAVRSEGPDVSRSDHARHSAMRSRPIPVCSCTARMSAASTATRSCCCGRCSSNSAIASSIRRWPRGRVLGVCVGAALAGQRPIGEMQFNDFVATGFNQLVNNAAKIRYRWGGERADGRAHAVGRSAPRRARTTPRIPRHGSTGRPGLKIVVPSTPHDARALYGVGRGRPRSGPLLRAHRALSRSPHQAGDRRGAARRRFRSAAPRCGARATTWRSSPTARTCTSRCGWRIGWRRTASRRACWICGRSSRSIGEALLAVARHCHRVLIVHEDARTGGIGESLAAIIQEEAFEWLDAPVRIVGALDTPVPYSPPLEEFYLPERGARSSARPGCSRRIESRIDQSVE